MHRHRARVDPRHQGGEGVAATPGVLTPRCSATRIRCMPVMRYRQRYVINTQSERPPLPLPLPKPKPKPKMKPTAATHNTQHTTHNTQHTTHNTQQTTNNKHKTKQTHTKQNRTKQDKTKLNKTKQPTNNNQQQHYSEPRRARWWVRTRKSVARAHLVTSCVDVFFGVKTTLLGQFSPTGAHRENCGP